jgi:transcriptional regulator with XRE-family HTH domain
MCFRFDLLFKEGREILGISQDEICQRLDISQALVSKIENNLTEPGAAIFIKFIELEDSHEFNARLLSFWKNKK